MLPAHYPVYHMYGDSSTAIVAGYAYTTAPLVSKQLGAGMLTITLAYFETVVSLW